MTYSKRGYEYENQLVKDIYEQTSSQCMPIPCGFSGNHAVPSPDFLIDDGEKVHAFEVKRASNTRGAKTFTYEGDDDSAVSDTDTDSDSASDSTSATAGGDIDQLCTFARAHPRTVCSYLGVRFNNRQLILGKVWHQTTDRSEVLDSIVTTTPTDAVITRSNNISMRKPESDVSDASWPSASAGDDVQYILDTIGV